MNKRFLLFTLLFLYINCCSPGYYLSSGKCLPCYPGHYSSNLNSNNCLECPMGTFSNSGSSSCTPCSRSYISAPNKTHCIPCGEGKYADKGKNKCIPCPKGYKSCSDSIQKKNLRRTDYQTCNTTQCIMEEFGKIITSDIFGKSIDFTNKKVTFYIPGYKIDVEVLEQVQLDINGNVRLKILNHAFVQNIEKDDDEKYNKIKGMFDQVLDALKGEYTIGYIELEHLLSQHMANGDIVIKLNIQELSLEITITSKIEVNENEFDVAVKYKITPTGNPDLDPEKEPIKESENQPVNQPTLDFGYRLLQSLSGILDFVNNIFSNIPTDPTTVLGVTLLSASVIFLFWYLGLMPYLSVILVALQSYF